MIEQKELVPKRRFEGFTEEWEKKKINKIADYRSGKAHERNVVATGKYVIVNSKFVSTNGHVRKFSNLQIEPLKKGEIAFVLSDIPNGRALARTYLVEEDNFFTLNQRIAGITANENTNSYFLKELMNRHKYFLSFDGGVGQTNLSNLDIENFESAYPCFEEQQKIGQFFKHLDEMIALEQRKIDKTKALKSAYLAEMFPAEGERIPKRRFEGFTGEWEIQKLANIVTNVSDGDWILKEHIFDKGKYRIIQTGNLGIGRYLDKIKNAKYFHQKDFNQLKANEIFPGDILISRLAEPAGRAIILPATGYRMVTSVDVTIIRPDNIFDSTFLMTLMNSEEVLSKINNEVTGTTHRRISRKNLERLELIVPKVSEQQKIGSFFKNIDDNIVTHQQKLAKLKATKQAYLHEMFV